MSSNYVFHTIAVGFHHRRGAIVETAYPPFGDETQSDHAGVPPEWKCLTSLSLPDGAHKFLKDSIYFTLPSHEEGISTVFGVASYHQVPSAEYSKVTPDVTRNTVQKSLVVLCRVPLFTFIAHHLSVMVESLFRDTAGFTLANVQRCHLAIEGLVSSVMREPSSYRDALYRDLNVDDLFRVYGRDALVLYKAVLLERRILFDGDSGGWLCHWILVLLSLFPGVIEAGLMESAVVDATWVHEPSCQCVNGPSVLEGGGLRDTVVLTANPRPPPPTRNLSERSLLQKACDLSDGPRTGAGKRSRQLTQQNRALTEEFQTALLNQQDSCVRPSTLRHSATDLRTLSRNEEITLESSHHPDVAGCLPSFPTDNWGFPLALFTKSNILPIYLPLCHLDTLLQSVETGFQPSRQVRGFLACATNPLLRSHRHLADLVVTGLPFPAGPRSVEGVQPTQTDLSGMTVAMETNKSSSSSSSTSLAKAGASDEATSGPAGSRVDPPAGSDLSAAIGRLRPGHLPRSGQSMIRITDSSPGQRSDPAHDLRALCLPINQALQLTRCDRQLADQLQRITTCWHASTQALAELATCAKADDLTTCISRLPVGQREMLQRFPTRLSLTTWVRQQMVNYLRAVLLTADGHGDTSTDFGSAFITCLRASHCFLVWRRQYRPSEVLIVSPPCALEPRPTEGQSASTLSTVPSSLANGEPTGQVPGETEGQSSATMMTHLLTQHPGRCFTDTAEWDQFVVGVRRFGNMAADHGRRLVTQSMVGLSRLANDPGSQPRSNQLSGAGFMSRISDAFKNMLIVAAARSNHHQTPP